LVDSVFFTAGAIVVFLGADFLAAGFLFLEVETAFLGGGADLVAAVILRASDLVIGADCLGVAIILVGTVGTGAAAALGGAVQTGATIALAEAVGFKAILPAVGFFFLISFAGTVLVFSVLLKAGLAAGLTGFAGLLVFAAVLFSVLGFIGFFSLEETSKGAVGKADIGAAGFFSLTAVFFVSGLVDFFSTIFFDIETPYEFVFFNS